MGEDGFAMGYALGQDSGGGSNGGFGGSWGEGLWAIIILAMLGFGGGRGFGGFGGGGGMADGFAVNNIDSGIRSLANGLCDSTYALNNSILNGFHGVDNAICTLGYQTQSGFNAIGTQLANCCCDIERAVERGFCDTNYNMATNTRDIIENANCNTRAILDFLTQDKISSLQAENQALRFSASQDRQNAYLTTAMTAQTNALIDRIAPYPIPSFPVCAPYNLGGYSGHGGFGGYGFNRGGDSCGCGCG